MREGFEKALNKDDIRETSKRLKRASREVNVEAASESLQRRAGHARAWLCAQKVRSPKSCCIGTAS